MYNIKKSNGVYYLCHGITNIMAKLDIDNFVYALMRKLNLTLKKADKVSSCIYCGDYELANELINDKTY